MTEYPAISLLIPHQGPIVLLDRIVSWSSGSVQCAMRVRHHARFVEDGLLAAPLTIEHMAQAVATCLGYAAYLDGRGVRVGMIVSCRAFKALSPAAVVGEELFVSANLESGNEALSQFQCEVRRDGEIFSTASLTLFHDVSLALTPASS